MKFSLDCFSAFLYSLCSSGRVEGAVWTLRCHSSILPALEYFLNSISTMGSVPKPVEEEQEVEGTYSFSKPSQASFLFYSTTLKLITSLWRE